MLRQELPLIIVAAPAFNAIISTISTALFLLSLIPKALIFDRRRKIFVTACLLSLALPLLNILYIEFPPRVSYNIFDFAFLVGVVAVVTPGSTIILFALLWNHKKHNFSDTILSFLCIVGVAINFIGISLLCYGLSD